MKLGLVVPGFSADETDWCIPALRHLVRELARVHDVHVFTLRYPHRRATYRAFGATVHALGGATASGWRRGPLLAGALHSVLAEARRGRFDALHGLWADEPGFVAVMAARLLRVRCVVSLMGGELVDLPQIGYGHQRSRAARSLIAASLYGADAVTIGSRTLYECARNRVPEQKRLVVCPLGVDTTLFSPNGTRADMGAGFHILHVASLEPIKDQTTLIRAFACVVAERPDARLHIIGTGRKDASLRALSHDCEVADNVVFHGKIAHDRLPAYYRAADVCILTSLYESQSMVVLEAGACGRGTVGTRTGLMPEIVPADWLISPGDETGLAARLLQLAQNPALRHDLDAHAHNRSESYHLDATVAYWLALYGESL